MTTIAWADGFMAGDSRATDESAAFCTRISKIYRLPNKALLGCAGDADSREVIELLGRATPKRLPSKKELKATETEFQGILVFTNGAIFYVDINRIGSNANDWEASVLECKERYAAVGSGQQFAMGALAAGKSAREAVEIAVKYDTMSGPPIVQIALNPTPDKIKAVAPTAPAKRPRKK